MSSVRAALLALLLLAACTDPASSGDAGDRREAGTVEPDLAVVLDGAAADLSGPCRALHDGVLSRAELAVVPGGGERFRVSPGGAPVQVVPPDGGWDYRDDQPGDEEVADPLLPVRGAWWSADYPGATFAARLDDRPTLLGVYRATDEALLLLGVVSEQPGVAQTSLAYAAPLTVLRLPLREGDRWSTESDVAGLLSGVIFAAHHRYDFLVDGRHLTRVPAGEYDTLRLRADRTERSGVRTTSRIEYHHLAECAGTVASLRSRDNEARADFTQAAAYRRRTAP